MSDAGICEYCGKEFERLTTHQRYCKDRPEEAVETDTEVSPNGESVDKPKQQPGYNNPKLAEWLEQINDEEDLPTNVTESTLSASGGGFARADRKKLLIELDSEGYFMTDDYALAEELQYKKVPPSHGIGETEYDEPRIYIFRFKIDELDKMRSKPTKKHI